MTDRARPLVYHLFVALLLGGLWLHADARRRMDEAAAFSLPAPGPDQMPPAYAAGVAADPFDPPTSRGGDRTETVGPDLLDEITR